MARRLAASALAATLGLSLVACPGNEGGRGRGDVPRPPPGPPRGSITVAYPYEPATLDPLARGGDAAATRDLLELMMPSLFSRTAHGKVVPELAAAVPSPGAAPREVTIELRDKARWSDGTPITVADLRATWRYATRSGSSAARDPFDRVRRIVAETPTRARIEFSGPFTRWADVFSGRVGVLPARMLGTRARRRALATRFPVSGGPFVLERWRPGLDMSFEPNPHALLPPRLAGIRMAFVPDATGALELFRARKVDLLGPYHAPDWRRRILEAGARSGVSRGGTWVGLAFNTEAGPLRERAVRTAIALAIDRARAVSTLVQEEGELLRQVPGAQGPFDVAPSLRRARALLEKAGWRGRPVRSKGGRELDMTLAVGMEDDAAGLVARAIQYQTARAGISLSLVPVETKDLWSEWLWGPRFDAAVLLMRDPPAGAVRARFSGERGISRMSDAALERTLALEDRGDARARAGARLRATIPVIPLYRVAMSQGHRNIERAIPETSADGPFWGVHEWFLVDRD